MPSYNYECKHHRTPKATTIIRSIQDPDTPPTCPTCKRPMQRLYGLTNVTFKGPGFYSTDKRS